MPTYEYRCRNCNEHLEVVQSFKDDPLTVCPHCEGELKKVFSPIGIAFKGSGFYRNDSRSGGSSSSSSASDSSTKSETKTETKSDSGSKSDSSSSSSSSKSESKAAS